MSYSGLSSSAALVLRFFVGMGFGSGGLASADDANLIGATIDVRRKRIRRCGERPMVMKPLGSEGTQGVNQDIQFMGSLARLG